MTATTLSGPLQIGNADGVFGTVIAARQLAIAVTATANTDLTIPMPDGYTLLRATTVTTTAFTGNTVTIQIGTAAAGDQVVAATTIKAAGTFAHTIVAGLNRNLTAQTLFVRIVQTATVTAVGAAVLYLEYIPTSQTWS